MRADHIEILVEEPSMEAFLTEWLPRLVGNQATFTIHAYQGKGDLIAKLGARLRGYARWLPDSWRIVILVDRDDEECHLLKRRLEQIVQDAGLRTRSTHRQTSWQVANRIVVEELESWFFGEWSAVTKAYPKASAKVPFTARFRSSDAISGGTWEAFERILKKSGYFIEGLRKAECARAVGMNFDHQKCTSTSFAAFRDVILESISTS